LQDLLRLAKEAREKRRTRQDHERALQDRLGEIREECKTFAGFTRNAWHILEPETEYKHNWHIDAIGEHLQAVNRAEINLLQINQPPGTMKSLTVSVMFGAWEWGPTRRPGLRYLTASYREDYALRDSRKMRDLVISPWYRALWPHVQLMRNGDGDFENTFRGRRKAVPFKSLTGERGNRVVIDDPHSLDQAESEQTRPATVQTFRESVPSRINDPMLDAIIVMMQRMHPEDVCGVIEELGLPYVKLILQMEYVPSLSVKSIYFEDPRTEMGELLHPSRFPRDKVELKKVELGPHAWDTQFQQRPRVRAGESYFSIENLLDPVWALDAAGKQVIGADGKPTVASYVAPPMITKCDTVYAVVDSASKTGKNRDGTGVKYFAYSKYAPAKRVWVIDWDVQQIDAALLITWLPNVFTQGEELAKLVGARNGFSGVWIEDKDSGTVLLQQAQLAKMGRVHAIDSKLTALGKDGRALKISGHVYKGHVRYCQPAYDKTAIYKGRTKSHSIDQVTGYRMGIGTLTDEDELFDCFCYGVDLSLGEGT
jgi:hypothetical protein